MLTQFWRRNDELALYTIILYGFRKFHVVQQIFRHLCSDKVSTDATYRMMSYVLVRGTRLVTSAYVCFLVFVSSCKENGSKGLQSVLTISLSKQIYETVFMIQGIFRENWEWLNSVLNNRWRMFAGRMLRKIFGRKRKEVIRWWRKL